MIRKLQRKKEHQQYFLRDGTGPLPGSSSVAKIGDDPSGLLWWAHQRGLAGEDYKQERDAAAEAGTVGHALSEAYLVGDTLDLSEWPKESIELGQAAFEQFKEWWILQNFTWMHSELQLVSHDYLFGGTLDILARDNARNICLIDLKTTNSIRTSFVIQCGGYSLLVNENFPDEPVDRVCILRLPKDGSPVEPLWIKPETFPLYHKCFLANLASWYARRALEKVDPCVKKWKGKKK